MQSDPAFDQFVQREPFFVVVPAPEYRAAVLTDAARLKFFRDGNAIVQALVRTIELRLAPHFAPTSILEYGCGIGRLALPLARLAARKGGSVTAVDTSPAMLAHARTTAATHAIDNITFTDPETVATGSRRFDFILCYAVLQRLRSADGIAVVDRLMRLLLPGGIVALQFPIWNRVSLANRATRWMRETIPGMNALVNMSRGQPADQPFIASHTYDLHAVLAVLDRAGLPATHMVFDDHGDLRSVIAIGESPLIARDDTTGHDDGDGHTTAAEPTGRSLQPSIDVRRVVAETSITDLNQRAEQYFSSLDQWDHHLAKPFASPAEAPWLLMNAAVLLRALDLTPGMSVLEFGAGTGWLSRFLTQMGCRVFLLDVSPTALEMARTLYERLPIIGAQPAPTFLTFDGRRIQLDDQSIDRVACFHAFHHAPNPLDMVDEFARILRPGGLAGFAEPGFQHSSTAQSQFEMLNYGVVENDVDVHHIWKHARAHGFADIRMTMFNGVPVEVSLDQYEDFVRGGPTTHEWTAATRVFLRNVANFVLIKEGERERDSRSIEGLACTVHVDHSLIEVAADTPIRFHVRLTNTGSASWLPRSATRGGVALGARIYDDANVLLSTVVLPDSLGLGGGGIQPGESVEVSPSLASPPPGDYRLEFDCVADGVTWFAQVGSKPGCVRLRVK